MSAFVIAHDDSEYLDSPIFHAGSELKQEAIALFTDRGSAQGYIDSAGWSDRYTVGELLPIQILKWFECAHEEGVDLIAINPDRNWHLFGERQKVILLDEPREAFARLLRTELISVVEQPRSVATECAPYPIANSQVAHSCSDAFEPHEDQLSKLHAGNSPIGSASQIKDDDIVMNEVIERLNKLGISCDSIPTHSLASATAAISCFPMYMVASVAKWTDAENGPLKLKDLFGVASLREAYALGEREAELEIDSEHAKILHTLLTDSKPPTLVVHEYALETLRLFLSVADRDLVEIIRIAIARMMVSVAMASGEGWFGTNGAPTDEQRKCIRLIGEQLGLQQSQTASTILRELRA